MDIQKLVSQTIAGSMSTLGGEPITIKSQTISAVWGEVNTEREIMGGSRVQQDVNVQFPTDPDLKLREGMIVEGRDQKWKVGSVRKGKAMTTLDLTETNRVSLD
jgi:hypothetical protein|tara:strand:+ start:113 stop:424 length:312 start_codon:yes stop_codon:yes gene_type:complete